MTLSDDLLNHALNVWKTLDSSKPDEAALRRAVSSSYYALFHQLKADAVQLIAPNVPAAINHRIQRWFDHAEMKRICGRFLNEKLDQPLLSLLGSAVSSDLQLVCRNFIRLQEARHSSDYDLGYTLSRNECAEFIEAAAAAIGIWKKIKDTAEANIFILSLLLWKNWEDKERRA